MSIRPWNFPCWQDRDEGPPVARGIRGMVSECGPGALNPAAQPFVNNICTIIFSFLFRSGWSDSSVAGGFFSIGEVGAFGQNPPLAVFYIDDGSGNIVLRILSRNTNTGTERYNFDLGDEDGVSWLADDKWYQVGLCLTATGLSYAVNGNPGCTVVKTLDNPGASEFHEGSERLFVGSSAATGASNPIFISSGWPTCVVGPAAMSAVALDFSDLVTRNRIWDSNGDFKNPGENGSLWLGDTYSAQRPSIWLPNGSAQFENGSFGVTWTTRSGGGSGYVTTPGCLRKQYE